MNEYNYDSEPWNKSSYFLTLSQQALFLQSHAASKPIREENAETSCISIKIHYCLNTNSSPIGKMELGTKSNTVYIANYTKLYDVEF